MYDNSSQLQPNVGSVLVVNKRYYWWDQDSRFCSDFLVVSLLQINQVNMATSTNGDDIKQSLRDSVTYKSILTTNGHCTIMKVNGAYVGHYQRCGDANTASKGTQRTTENNDEEIFESFNTLKEKRKNLRYQTISTNEMGLFVVSVMVDYVHYFGKGETLKSANNDCAANVLSALDSGEHANKSQELQINAFNALEKLYNNLLYQTMNCSDNKYDIFVNVDGIDYFGEGTTYQEARNNTAWEVLKSIWSGAHEQIAKEIDEYWYDESYTHISSY